MRIAVIGTGYVGLVTAACLAQAGHDVLAIDRDATRVQMLHDGQVPFYEPGLAGLVQQGVGQGRLRFETSMAAVSTAQLAFICVGTPPRPDGAADMHQLFDAARELAVWMAPDCLVVQKSTAPIGTADRVVAAVQAGLAQRGLAPEQQRARVAANPEFLREGSAVRDFGEPDRVVIGVAHEDDARLLRELYRPFVNHATQLLVMDRRSAELAKYGANSMLAARVALINELARIAQATGADIEQVRAVLGSDPRIGPQFLAAGCGYGGSCFPKDVKALGVLADCLGVDVPMLHAINGSNELHKRHLVERLSHALGGLAGRTVAIWGLSFKPETDDLREAPSRTVIDLLVERGARVQAFDPAAMQAAARVWADAPQVRLCESPMHAARDADALVLLTEWAHFREPDFAALARSLRGQLVLDGRNLWRAAQVQAAGLRYLGVGRPGSEAGAPVSAAVSAAPKAEGVPVLLAP